MQNCRTRLSPGAEPCNAPPGNLLPRREQGEGPSGAEGGFRSEEHTSELQSQSNLVCRLLLEKKKPQRGPAHPRRVPQSRPLSDHRMHTACPKGPYRSHSKQGARAERTETVWAEPQGSLGARG